MKHFREDWIKEWCDDNGWTDLEVITYNQYWAFPPGGVMPEPIPSDTLKTIKSQKGLSPEEKQWIVAATIVSLSAGLFSYFTSCPMPLVLAFAFAAITTAKLEVEDL
jgi:hypothetical protein